MPSSLGAGVSYSSSWQAIFPASSQKLGHSGQTNHLQIQAAGLRPLTPSFPVATCFQFNHQWQLKTGNSVAGKREDKQQQSPPLHPHPQLLAHTNTVALVATAISVTGWLWD